MDDILKLLQELTTEEKAALVSGTDCPYNFAQGFVSLANGHLMKGIKCFCTKIEVPKLPKEKEEK